MTQQEQQLQEQEQEQVPMANHITYENARSHRPQKAVHPEIAVREFYLLEALWVSSKGKVDPFMRSQQALLERIKEAREEYVKQLALYFLDYTTLACAGEARHAREQAHSYNSFVPPARTMNRSLAAYSTLKYDRRSVLEACRELFYEANWKGSSYGGDKWGAIAEAGLMYYAHGADVFLDHCVDLTHNGGLYLNKTDVGYFTLGGGYWPIHKEYKQLLDFKRYCTPEELLRTLPGSSKQQQLLQTAKAFGWVDLSPPEDEDEEEESLEFWSSKPKPPKPQGGGPFTWVIPSSARDYVQGINQQQDWEVVAFPDDVRSWILQYEERPWGEEQAPIELEGVGRWSWERHEWYARVIRTALVKNAFDFLPNCYCEMCTKNKMEAMEFLSDEGLLDNYEAMCILTNAVGGILSWASAEELSEIRTLIWDYVYKGSGVHWQDELEELRIKCRLRRTTDRMENMVGAIRDQLEGVFRCLLRYQNEEDGFGPGVLRANLDSYYGSLMRNCTRITNWRRYDFDFNEELKQASEQANTYVHIYESYCKLLGEGPKGQGALEAMCDELIEELDAPDWWEEEHNEEEIKSDGTEKAGAEEGAENNWPIPTFVHTGKLTFTIQEVEESEEQLQ